MVRSVSDLPALFCLKIPRDGQLRYRPEPRCVCISGATSEVSTTRPVNPANGSRPWMPEPRVGDCLPSLSTCFEKCRRWATKGGLGTFLTKKGQGEEGEVPIPAYEAMRQDGELGNRMLEILLRGVSTRQYGQVIPEMAETAGVSRSSVSREAMEAIEEELRRLCERRFDDVDLLIIYLDGVILGEHHVLVAVGADTEGRK